MTAGATYLGVPIEFVTTVGSTNDELLRRADEGAAEGTVLVADEQTAGRGRNGRSWWDKPGNSLLFSVLLHPEIPLARFPLLGIAMACAVAETGPEIAGATLMVKWPNDVLHQGRKLCGILAEARPGRVGGVGAGGVGAGGVAGGGPGGVHILVIGTGINVNQNEEDFPRELRGAATSLRIAAGGRAIDRHALLGSVLSRFERFRALAAAEGPEALRAAVLPRLPRPGSAIVVQTANGRLEGTVDSILETGALLVKDASGARVPVVAGEIPLGGGNSR